MGARLSNALSTMVGVLVFGVLAVLLIVLLRAASPIGPTTTLTSFRFRSEDIQLLAEVRLTEDGWDIGQWSPDGSRLLLTRSEDTTQDRHLAILDVETGSLQALPRPGLGPVWSPDGNAIIFSGADREVDRHLWLYTLSNARLYMLTTAPPSSFGMWWLPDNRLLYQSNDGLWAMPVSSASPEVPAPLGTPYPATPQLLLPFDATGAGRWASPAPDGSAVVFYDGTVDDDRHMWMVQPDGSRIEFDQPRGSPGTCCAWAPDSSHFAFFSPQPEYGLYVVDRAGQNRRLVLAASTLGEGLFISMSFSPDGQVIAFEWSAAGAGAPFDNTQIYLVNLDGSGMRQLTLDSSAPHRWLNWSPDGRHIAFQRNDGSVWAARLMMPIQENTTPDLIVTPNPTATPAPPTEVPAPTAAPPPTVVLPDGSFATATPVPLDPVYATQEAALQATIAAAQANAVARATASPFPTAGPPIIQTGQPAIAIAQRDGLSFEVRLPKDTYLAGEGGQAEITVRNDSTETVFFQNVDLVLLDERGHEPNPWPWSPMAVLGRYRGFGLGKIAAGEELTTTLHFQIPPAEQAAGHVYTFWVETSFSHALPGYPEGWDNIWLRFETGPIPLQVTVPDVSQQLTAELQIDRTGWQLRVIDAAGQTPPGPWWGEIEATFPNGAMAGPLQESTDGAWSGMWGDDRITQSDGPIIMRAWIAAPGYVTGAAIQAVPDDISAEEIERRFALFEPPIPQTFSSLDAAQATLDFPLYRPVVLSAGSTLDAVQIETMPYGEHRRTNVTQAYVLPNNSRLELTQIVTTEDYASAGWGQARYAWETQSVTVGDTIGFVVQRFGWWVLDWKVGDVGFELRAPVPALSLEELLIIATGIKSQ